MEEINHMLETCVTHVAWLAEELSYLSTYYRCATQELLKVVEGADKGKGGSHIVKKPRRHPAYVVKPNRPRTNLRSRVYSTHALIKVGKIKDKS